MHLCAAVFIHHPTFWHGIHPSSSLFSGDGATWQGHVSQSISTLSSTGISIWRNALLSWLGVVCLQEMCACVCVCVCVCMWLWLWLWLWHVVSGWAGPYPVIHLSAPKPLSWWGSSEHCHLTSTMTIIVCWRWKMADWNDISDNWWNSLACFLVDVWKIVCALSTTVSIMSTSVTTDMI